MQRMTVSLPAYLYENLIKLVPPRKISSFVSAAVEKEILKVDVDPVADFITLRQKLPKVKSKVIFEAIRKGRL